jgi:hypothetical protein
MIINLEIMKKRLEQIKSNCSSWISSSDGSYEACLHDKGYYKLQKDIQLVERLDEIEDIMDNLMDEHDAILQKLGEDLR